MVEFEMNCVEVDDSELNDVRVDTEHSEVEKDGHKEPFAISQVPS